MSAENQFVSVLWTSPGRGTNANEAEVLQLQDRMKGRLNSFISPDNTVLPASRGPGVYTPTCRTQVTLGGEHRAGTTKARHSRSFVNYLSQRPQ